MFLEELFEKAKEQDERFFGKYSAVFEKLQANLQTVLNESTPEPAVVKLNGKPQALCQAVSTNSPAKKKFTQPDQLPSDGNDFKELKAPPQSFPMV